MPLTPGSISYIRIPSRNLIESMEFYRLLFDWSFTPNTEDILLFRDPNGLWGGFTTAVPPAEGGVCLFIDVADIAAKLSEITAAGGTVVQDKRPVGGPGFYALARDPHGNLLGLDGET